MDRLHHLCTRFAQEKLPQLIPQDPTRIANFGELPYFHPCRIGRYQSPANEADDPFVQEGIGSPAAFAVRSSIPRDSIGAISQDLAPPDFRWLLSKRMSCVVLWFGVVILIIGVISLQIASFFRNKRQDILSTGVGCLSASLCLLALSMCSFLHAHLIIYDWDPTSADRRTSSSPQAPLLTQPLPPPGSVITEIMSRHKNFKFTILTPWTLLPVRLPEEDCRDDVADKFAELLCARTKLELGRFSFWPRARGEAVLYDSFETFEERFLKHSEYAVIVLSAQHTSCLDMIYPRLLVFFTMKPSCVGRFLLVILGETEKKSRFDSRILTNAPIIMRGKSRDGWLDDQECWNNLLGILKKNLVVESAEQLNIERASPIPAEPNRWMSVTDLRGRSYAVKVTETSSQADLLSSSLYNLATSPTEFHQFSNSQSASPLNAPISSLCLVKSESMYYPPIKRSRNASSSDTDEQARSSSVPAGFASKSNQNEKSSPWLNPELSPYLRRQLLSHRSAENLPIAESNEECTHPDGVSSDEEKNCLMCWNKPTERTNGSTRGRGLGRSRATGNEPRSQRRFRRYKTAPSGSSLYASEYRKPVFQRVRDRAVSLFNLSSSKERNHFSASESLGETLRSLAHVSTDILHVKPFLESDITTRQIVTHLHAEPTATIEHNPSIIVPTLKIETASPVESATEGLDDIGLGGSLKDVRHNPSTYIVSHSPDDHLHSEAPSEVISSHNTSEQLKETGASFERTHAHVISNFVPFGNPIGSITNDDQSTSILHDHSRIEGSGARELGEDPFQVICEQPNIVVNALPNSNIFVTERVPQNTDALLDTDIARGTTNSSGEPSRSDSINTIKHFPEDGKSIGSEVLNPQLDEENGTTPRIDEPDIVAVGLEPGQNVFEVIENVNSSTSVLAIAPTHHSNGAPAQEEPAILPKDSNEQILLEAVSESPDILENEIRFDDLVAQVPNLEYTNTYERVYSVDDPEIAHQMKQTPVIVKSDMETDVLLTPLLDVIDTKQETPTEGVVDGVQHVHVVGMDIPDPNHPVYENVDISNTGRLDQLYLPRDHSESSSGNDKSALLVATPELLDGEYHKKPLAPETTVLNHSSSEFGMDVNATDVSKNETDFIERESPSSTDVVLNADRVNAETDLMIASSFKQESEEPELPDPLGVNVIEKVDESLIPHSNVEQENVTGLQTLPPDWRNPEFPMDSGSRGGGTAESNPKTQTGEGVSLVDETESKTEDMNTLPASWASIIESEQSGLQSTPPTEINTNTAPPTTTTGLSHVQSHQPSLSETLLPADALGKTNFHPTESPPEFIHVHVNETDRETSHNDTSNTTSDSDQLSPERLISSSMPQNPSHATPPERTGSFASVEESDPYLDLSEVSSLESPQKRHDHVIANNPPIDQFQGSPDNLRDEEDNDVSFNNDITGKQINMSPDQYYPELIQPVSTDPKSQSSSIGPLQPIITSPSPNSFSQPIGSTLRDLNSSPNQIASPTDSGYHNMSDTTESDSGISDPSESWYSWFAGKIPQWKTNPSATTSSQDMEHGDDAASEVTLLEAIEPIDVGRLEDLPLGDEHLGEAKNVNPVPGEQMLEMEPIVPTRGSVISTSAQIPLGSQPSDLQLPGAQLVEAQPPSTEPLSVQPLNTQTVDSQPRSIQPLDAQSLGTQPSDVQPLGVQLPDAQLVDAQPLDTQPLSVQPLNVQNLGSQPRSIQPLDAQYLGMQPSDVQPLGVQLPDAQLVDAQPLDTQPLSVKPLNVQNLGSQPRSIQPLDAQYLGTQPSDVQPLGVQLPNVQLIDAQPLDTQPLIVQPLNVRNLGSQPLSIQPSDAQSLGTQPSDVQLPGAQPVDAQPLDMQPMSVQTLNAQTLKSQPLSIQPSDAQSLGTQPMDAQLLGEQLPGAQLPDMQPLGTQALSMQPLSAPPLRAELPGAQPGGEQPMDAQILGTRPLDVESLHTHPLNTQLMGTGILDTQHRDTQHQEAQPLALFGSMFHFTARNFRLAITWNDIQDRLHRPTHVVGLFLVITTASPHLRRWPVIAADVLHGMTLSWFQPPYWIDRPILSHLNQLIQHVPDEAPWQGDMLATSFTNQPWLVANPPQ